MFRLYFNAVFLCYSAWCLNVILCGFAVFIPPYIPQIKWQQMTWRWMKLRQKTTDANTIVKYCQLHGLDLHNMWNDCFWNLDWELYPHPHPHPKGTSSLQAGGRDRGIFQRGAEGGSKLQNIAAVSNHYFRPFDLAVTFFCFVMQNL